MEDTELVRQTSYIIAVHDITDKFAMENSLEEAELYLKSHPSRKVIVISENWKSEDIKTIPFRQVMVFKKGNIRLVLNGGSDMDNVVETASKLLKNGLIILNDVNLSETTLKTLIERKERGQDIIIHRNILALYQSELTFLEKEINAMKYNIANGIDYRPKKSFYFRIHKQDDFQLSKEYVLKLFEDYGQELGPKIFLSQFILLKKQNQYRKMLELECEKNQQLFEDFIDPYWFSMESSNFLYLNLVTNDIVGADKDFLNECDNELNKYFANASNQ